jgi:hypothetical protein
MVRFLERCRFVFAGIALMMAGNAFGQEKGQADLWKPRYFLSGETVEVDPKNWTVE